jgi:ribosomal protein S18 acetylase RimI-like enzyme
MAPELRVRSLDADDLAAYKSLRDETLALHAEAFTSDAATERAKPAASYRSRLEDPAGDPARFTLGAWVDRRLVGAISCERDERVKVRHIAHIVGMMVCAQARGRGVGRALLDACVARSRQVREIEMLTLSVTATNATAVALYEGARFERYGRLVHAIKVGDTYHDKDLMVLRF